MRIKKSQLNEIISGYLNEVFGFQRFTSTGNPRIDSFREELRTLLTRYYKKSNKAATELLGTVDRKVGRILKAVWSKHVDRSFVDSVVKIHYMRVSNLPDFFANMNTKNEISTVGFLPGEMPLSSLSLIKSRRQVAVRLKGYTTLASNENMNSGRISPEDAEKYSSSGVPKFADSDDQIKNIEQHISSLYMQGFTLQSQLERISRFVILDRESHMTNTQRGANQDNNQVKQLKRAFSFSNLSDWNEYVLDNWEVDAIIDISNFKETNVNEYSHLEVFAESRGIPILTLEEATK